MWQFLTETWTYDPGISKLATALAIIAVAGIPILIYAWKTKRRLLRTLWWVGVLLIPAVAGCFLAVDYYHWVDAWDGEIVSMRSENGWSLRTGGRKTVHTVMINLDGIGPAVRVTVSPFTYSQVIVGDYITKKRGSHLPEVQR